MKKRLLFILFQTAILSWLAVTMISASASPDRRVEPSVWDELHDHGQVEVIIQLTPADLSRAYTLPDKTERGQWVYETLRREASRIQAPLLAELEQAGASYQRFWVVNAIRTQVNARLLTQLLRFPQVQRVTPDIAFRSVGPKPETTMSTQADDSTLPWGLERVNAPWAWEQGVTGQGVVVAGQDTGYDWRHEALKRAYRGYDAAMDEVSHDYNWHDAIHEEDPNNSGDNPCGLDSPEPCDDYGHGTHTMGTMVGNDGIPGEEGWPQDATHPIGVAPGAQWMACRNMERGWGKPSTYIECFQWFVAPWPIGGDSFNDGNPAMAPDVINNSWSCPVAEGCTPEKLAVIEPALDAADAAGILVVASATNNGSHCNTITEPIAIYPHAFTVGATANNDVLASFSSRGPVSYNGATRIGPDVSAPGVGVYSSIPGNRYTSMSGTSMAGPHVAGVAALLMAAEPALKGQTDMIRAILSRTADPQTSSQGCGDDAPDAVPNNGFGWGIVNIRSAIESLSQPATIAGVVRDVSGDAIMGENVTVKAYRYPSGELVASSETTLSGDFVMTAPWGSYTLRVSVIDGAGVVGPIYAVGGQETSADIILPQRIFSPYILK